MTAEGAFTGPRSAADAMLVKAAKSGKASVSFFIIVLQPRREKQNQLSSNTNPGDAEALCPDCNSPTLFQLPVAPVTQRKACPVSARISFVVGEDEIVAVSACRTDDA